MRFVIHGAGAIGGLVGALLHHHGSEVVLIARGAHSRAIESSGLTVESPGGRRVHRVPTVQRPSDAEIGADDVIVLAVKSQDTTDALNALRAVTPPATPVVCMQNGVENERATLRIFERVYGVCVMCPAAHMEPGVVQAFSAPVPGVIDLGRYPAGRDAVSGAVAAAFREATFESIERDDIMRWKYRKLLMNLGNAVEAVCRGPGRSKISKLAQEEGVACLQAAGLDFVSAEEDAARRGDLVSLHEVGGASRGGGSSWQSLARGTGSIESDYLNGEVVLLGRMYGVATPVNALLQRQAAEMAQRRAPPGSMSVRDFFSLLQGG